MFRNYFSKIVILLTLLVTGWGYSWAAADLEVNTPAIVALKSSMQKRHQQLSQHYSSGAVGLTRDGLISLRDANVIPLAQRQTVNSLVSAENQDRKSLYHEVALANNHPEWEEEIRGTFASRWIQKAQAGWWIQDSTGAWVKK
jgi:uncharacterized protein YdbL (DUF1318 family)